MIKSQQNLPRVACEFLAEANELATELVHTEIDAGLSPSRELIVSRMVTGADLGRAIDVLLKKGHWMAAAVLLRALVEHFIVSGWINHNDDRAMAIDEGHDRRIDLLVSKIGEHGFDVSRVPVMGNEERQKSIPKLEKMAEEADEWEMVENPVFKETYDSLFRFYSGWTHGYRKFVGLSDPAMVFLIARDAAGILVHLTTLSAIVLDIEDVRRKAEGLARRLANFERERSRTI